VHRGSGIEERHCHCAWAPGLMGGHNAEAGRRLARWICYSTISRDSDTLVETALVNGTGYLPEYYAFCSVRHRVLSINLRCYLNSATHWCPQSNKQVSGRARGGPWAFARPTSPQNLAWDPLLVSARAVPDNGLALRHPRRPVQAFVLAARKGCSVISQLPGHAHELRND
jgi:hypothetical protein